MPVCGYRTPYLFIILSWLVQYYLIVLLLCPGLSLVSFLNLKKKIGEIELNLRLATQVALKLLKQRLGWWLALEVRDWRAVLISGNYPFWFLSRHLNLKFHFQICCLYDHFQKCSTISSCSRLLPLVMIIIIIINIIYGATTLFKVNILTLELPEIMSQLVWYYAGHFICIYFFK